MSKQTTVAVLRTPPGRGSIAVITLSGPGSDNILARVFRPRWFRRRWIVKELASLSYSTPPNSATATDRLRFLRVYLGRDRFSAADRRLIRRVARKTGRIATHDARRRQGNARRCQQARSGS